MLLIGMVMLAVVSLLGIVTLQTVNRHERMALNFQDRQKAQQGAESAIRYAWEQLNANSGDIGEEDTAEAGEEATVVSPYSLKAFVQNSGHAGHYDLRGTDAESGSRTTTDFVGVIRPSTWPWSDTAKRAAVPSSLSGVLTADMGLDQAPQFIIGMQAPVQRKGSEGRQCIPYRILGASKGADSATQVMIQVWGFPENSCFLDPVQ